MVIEEGFAVKMADGTYLNTDIPSAYVSFPFSLFSCAFDKQQAGPLRGRRLTVFKTLWIRFF